MGSRIRYNVGKLTFEGALRTLLIHEEKKYREWGASVALRIEPDESGQGLSLNIEPVWGTASSGTDRLWSQETGGLVGDQSGFEAGKHLEAEIGYGLGNPRARLGILTPYFGLSLGEDSKPHLPDRNPLDYFSKC